MHSTSSPVRRGLRLPAMIAISALLACAALPAEGFSRPLNNKHPVLVR